MLVRLNKFLSRAGIASRREADRLIGQGRVSVNGRAAELGVRVDEARDRVAVNGRPVQANPRTVHILLNKPAGYLVTMKDPQGRPTIRKLLSGLPPGVVPVGRLDFDSEGLLLLTNDGELAFRLTHPRYEIAKTYQVSVEGEVTPETLARLRRGVMIDGMNAAPDAAVVLEAGPQRSRLRVELHEGRKREVRRMLEAVGHRVLKLKRTSFGALTVKGVPPGGWRPLTGREVSALKKRVGLTAGESVE